MFVFNIPNRFNQLNQLNQPLPDTSPQLKNSELLQNFWVASKIYSGDLKLLIIDDEPGLVNSMKTYLSGEGIVCEIAVDVKSAVEKISQYEYDAIVLDIGLPDGNGLEILKHIKALQKDEGVIIISARNSLDERLSGLNLGADDYLVKPFHLAELKARITAVYRRKNFKGHNFLKHDEIEINLDSREVRIDGRLLVLTRKEFDMLLYFISNKGKVVTRSALVDHLWKDEFYLSENLDFIYTHVKNLRKKMQEAAGKDYLTSVYGIGYKFI